MFDRASPGNRAVLVHMHTSDETRRENLSEFVELASSAGAEILDTATSSRHTPDARYFVGKGKATEIKHLVKELRADLVLFNHALSPSQERNLEAFLQCRVLDRTGLILDIFAQRARSFEGKLQVELAQLKHLSTRLVRGWTHLERQKGGIGLRGPGETQLETDRRLLGLRIKQINKRLEKVRKQREQGRQSRRKAEIPTVSLVGYTNAGKSTLFNVITDAGVYVQDQLFATLDPTLRKVNVDNDVEIILADTVGFIRHLPHDLVEAFRSTLQETAQAHLLLHVIDASDENRDSQIEEVEAVLEQIQADRVQRIQIINKIDRHGVEPRVDYDAEGNARRIWLSAQTGEGIDLLRNVLARFFKQEMVVGQITLLPAQARLRALLFELGAVTHESVDQRGRYLIELCIARKELQKLASREKVSLDQLISVEAA
ncbi:MAG: ribosome rescue GTPase HflX [Gammaproteobacteria bacterium]